MAANIKGITVDIGGNTQPLQKSLEEVNKTAKGLASELRIVDKLLKLDPSNTTLLAQKQKILAESISNTESKLKTLKKAQEQAKEQLSRGDIGEDQYRALERQVEATEISLKDLKSQAQEAEDALAAIGQEGVDTAKDIDKIGDSTNKSEKEMKSFSVAGVAAFTAVAAAIGATIGKLASFLTDSVESTKEFRADLTKLEQNAKSAGTSLDDVSGNLEYFIAVTDETDSSVEALSNLLQAGFKDEALTKAVNNLSGAVIKFPDTLKIESLADSLQETLATGEATGQYGELLERLGVNLEDFNDGLKKCTTSAKKQEYAINILAKNGLSELNEEYMAANAEMIAYSTAQTKYTRTLAKVGTAMQPVMTAFTNIKTLLLESMIPALEETGEALSKKLASPSVQSSIKKLGKVLGELAKGVADFAIFVIENGEEIIKIIAGIGAAFAALKIAKSLQSGIEAIKKLGNALSSTSGVVGLVLAGVTALAGAISAIIGPGEEFKQLADDAESLATSTKEASQAIKDELGALETQKKALPGLLDRLYELNDIQNKSATEQKEMANIVSRLNQQYNGLGLEIDSSTGKLNQNRKQLEANTTAIYENAKAMAKQEAYNEAVKNYLDNEIGRAKAIDKTREALKQSALFSEKQIDVMTDEEIVWLSYAEALRDSHGALIAWGADSQESLRAVQDYDKGMKEATSTIEYLTEGVDEATLAAWANGEAIDSTTESTKDLTDATRSLTDTEAMWLMQRQEAGEALSESDAANLEAWKENNAERAEEMEAQLAREQEIYQKRVDAATDANSKINLAEQISLEQATENLKANTAIVEDYVDDMDYLYGRIPDTVYQYLEEAGVEQARLVSEMADDMRDGGDEVAQRFINAYLAALEAGKSPAEAAGFALGDSTGTGMAENDSIITEAEAQLKDTVESMSDIIIADNTFNYLGMGIINRLANGMRTLKWKVLDVAEGIVDEIKEKFNFSVSVTSTSSGAKIRGYDSGGYFTSPQIIQIAEKRPEFVGAADDLESFINKAINNAFVGVRPIMLQDIRLPNTSRRGNNVEINITMPISVSRSLSDADIRQKASTITTIVSREFAKATGGRMA